MLREKTARRFIDAATTNSHAAVKNVWLILFTVGGISALHAMNNIFMTLGVLDGTPYSETPYPAISLALMFVYFLTFFRFYVGDVRIFDLRYTEIYRIFDGNIDDPDPKETQLEAMSEYIKLADKNSLRYESIFLIFQTIVISFLAFQILNPANFVKVYVFLMVINSAWLFILNLAYDSSIAERLDTIFNAKTDTQKFSAIFPLKPGYVWIANNLFCAFAIGITSLVFLNQSDIFPLLETSFGLSLGTFSVELTLTLAAGFMILNCTYDIVKAKDFYFPRFHKFYDAQLPAPTEETLNRD